MAVVEHQCRESAVGEPLGERGQACGLHPTNAVRHHHNWVGARSGGKVKPGVHLITTARGYPNVVALVEIACHALASRGVTISPPANLANSAPNRAPGVNAPGTAVPSPTRSAAKAAILAVNA